MGETMIKPSVTPDLFSGNINDIGPLENLPFRLISASLKMP